jgi:hypothetical protein
MTHIADDLLTYVLFTALTAAAIHKLANYSVHLFVALLNWPKKSYSDLGGHVIGLHSIVHIPGNLSLIALRRMLP